MIYEIKHFGCKNEIPHDKEILYMINYAKKNNCIVEFKIEFDVNYYDSNKQEIVNALRPMIIEITSSSDENDIMRQIYEFRQEIILYIS